MNRSFNLSVVGLAAVAAIALAQPTKETTKPVAKPAPTAAQPAGEMPPLPKGWTAEDMEACMAAATPGEQHAHLAQSLGTWTGKSTMWMAPDSDPVKSDCTATVGWLVDGKFTKCEWSGDMPGMGPFTGFGTYGFDNVAQKYQSTWVDNMGTGMMIGTGDLSSDGKTMTWTFKFNCPVAKKLVTMREVDKWTGKDTKTMEMYAPDPKTGKEYKMLEVALTRTAGAATAKPVNTTAPAVKPTR